MKDSQRIRTGSLKGRIEELVDKFGRRFSTELNIRLEGSDKDEVFKWLIASILFGARISEKIAIRTYHRFIENDLKTPDSLIRAGWDKLVEILDSGGYARYDFKTATKMLEVMKNLNDQYRGNLNLLHASASDPRDLEMKIKQLGKGIGDVTASIFLRELRDIWSKASPLPQDLVINAARSLGLTRKRGKDEVERLAILRELQDLWSRNKIKHRSFVDFEAALVRYGKDVIRRRRMLRS